MPTLRHIAVHVEEPRSGQFVWVLTERSGADWQALSKSKAPARSYKVAMADGLLALQQLVEDLDLGPRERQDETAGRPPSHASPRSSSSTPTKGAHFGFGPAR